MTDFEATMKELTTSALSAADEVRKAGDELAAEGEKIRESLKRADALAAYIVEHAQSETLSTHVEISFEPHAAAMIANMADAYRQVRGDDQTSPAARA